jgi:uncharacterized membrane protein
MSSIVQSFEAKELEKRSLLIKAADRLTGFFGSVWFLGFNVTLFFSWIVINLGYISGIPIFDPFPFFFLTTGVSLEAIILTIIVLVSQQRQSQVGKIREELDMIVNKISEKEITKSLSILKLIAEKQGIKLDNDKELDQMLKNIEYSYIEKKLGEQLADKPKNIVGEIKEVVEKVTSSLETISPIK